MKRRDFIKIGGVVGAGTLLVDGCSTPIKTATALVPEDAPIPGAEEWLMSVCTECNGGCGAMVRVVDGHAKKVEGNPAHPINKGKTCARGQATLQALYNPDRLQKPRKRVGRRGDPQAWQEITWDEAIKIATEHLQALRQQNKPHAFVFLTGALRSHLQILISRFMTAYGSPNQIVYEPFGNTAVAMANKLNTGDPAFAVHDVENANFVLSFGANFLETYLSPVRYSLGFGHLRQGRPGLRGRVAQIESRFSLTAANADEWIPVKPGNEGDVALAIAHIMISENLYDKDFVALHTTGFEVFKEKLTTEYTPENVSVRSGVPVSRLYALARRFATHRPSLAWGGDAAAAHTNGVTAMMAVNALNALNGSYGRPGGIYFDPSPPLTPLPDILRDAVASQGLSKARIDGMSSIGPSAIMSESPGSLFSRLHAGEESYPMELLFLYAANPVFTEPGLATFRKTLERIPFIVSFSSFMDETTSLADLVIPEPASFERWVDDIPSPGVGVPMITLGKPVVKPLYGATPPKENLSMGDALLAMATSLGGTISASMPWATYADLLKASVLGLFQQKRGSVVEEDFDSFWDTLQQKGGWWDLSGKKEAVFKTPSGKFEFMPAGVKFLHITAQFEGNTQDYPFHLNIYPTMTFSDGRGANRPWLQELPDPMTSIAWNSWVEINPQTADRLGLADDDWVWVESPQGRLQCPVHRYAGAMPDVISLPVGQGHQEYGRYARQRGANPLQLVTKQVDVLSGATAWAATRARLVKVGGKARVARIGFDRMPARGEHKIPVKSHT
ncbi:MAG: molybdopterin-dependent oxidoreductase [Acidobacteria bacterium]|nr:molybdopterin-dependent oxidoreductase [Acidobacteriota bacterium]MBI3658611.1 molybdopterin-dependent oxidoreductase [Acidobacteriota bacterium]